MKKSTSSWVATVTSGKLPSRVNTSLPITQAATGQLADHHRVHPYLAVLQQVTQASILATQMINPDRRIDKDHVGSARRRGMDSNCGSLPPSFANRLALSRSMRACKPCCTSFVFSQYPSYVEPLTTTDHQCLTLFSSQCLLGKLHLRFLRVYLHRILHPTAFSLTSPCLKLFKFLKA